MAVQNLTRQSIAFILNSGDEIDQTIIMSNSLIQAFQQNSAGGALLNSYQTYFDSSGNAHTYLLLEGFIQTSFQATVQQNIPTLQSAFPGFTLATWGTAVQFGY